LKTTNKTRLLLNVQVHFVVVVVVVVLVAFAFAVVAFALVAFACLLFVDDDLNCGGDEDDVEGGYVDVAGDAGVVGVGGGDVECVVVVDVDVVVVVDVDVVVVVVDYLLNDFECIYE
jgi:hypothetical protein